MSLLTNLVSYWKLDGNSNDSVGGHNGVDTVISYGTSYGKVKQGAYGNGITSKIRSDFVFAPTAFSISWWLYPTALLNYNQQMLAINSWGSFVFHSGVGGACWCGTDIGTRFDNSNLPTGTLTQDAWNHIVYTFDGTYGRFYKNGVLLATKAHNAPATFGGIQFGTGEFQTINGALDEVGLWSRALSLSEIQSLYNGGTGLSYPFNLEYTNETKNVVAVTNEQNKSQPQNGLIAYYKLDEISGNAIDSVGGNTAVNTAVTYEASKINNGARFKSCFANLLAYYKFDESSGNAADSISSATLTNQSVTYEAAKINNGARFRSCFADIVYYWKFDEASGDAIDSINSKALINTAVTYAASKINNGAVFNGSTSKYALSGISIPKAAFSISFWMRPESVSSYYYLLLFGDGTNIVRLYADSSGNMELDQMPGEIGNTHITDLTLNVWQMITITWDGTTTTIYKNGVYDAATVAPYTFGTLTTMDIAWPGAVYYKGGLDELGIWSRCLSASEITDLYNATNGLTYSVSSKLTAAASVIPLGAKTISFWLKTLHNSTSSPVVVANCGFFAAHHGTSIILDKFTAVWNYGQLMFGFRKTDTTIDWVSSTIAVNDGVMRHITCTWDGTTNANAAKIYINGVLNNQGTFTTTEVTAATQNLSVGADIGGGQALTGIVDELGIWNRALEQAEITDLYNASVGLALASPSVLNVAHTEAINLNTNFSIGCWFKSTLRGTYFRAIIAKYGYGGTTPYWGVGWTAENTIGFIIRDSANVLNKAEATAGVGLDGNWHYLTATLSDSYVGFYIDGVLQQETVRTVADIRNTRPILFATHASPLATNIYSSTITLDEVGIWNRVLTATEVTDIYNAGSGRAYPLSLWVNETK